MYDILTLNKISQIGLKELDSKYAISDSCENPDGIIVRSAAMHDFAFSDKTVAVARAGAGVNNIPVEDCTKKGIVVFNTPGANANGVKELVLAGMLYAARDIVGGIDWCLDNQNDENIAKTAEKQKKNFAGTEISGKKLGVIGLGAIGVLVANAAVALGMEVYGCDPYLSVKNALNLSRSVTLVKTNAEIYEECDYISVHVPLLNDTKGMINKASLSMMKDGVVILNFARDLLVNDDDMQEALESGKVAKYVTDFPNAKTANMDGVIAFPHLGASTAESEDNCAIMAVDELVDYVLSAEEMGALLIAKQIDVAKEESLPDTIIPTSSGRNFAVSGGVAESVKIRLKNPEILKATVINGLSKAGMKQLAAYGKIQTGESPITDETPNLIEVMACEGGCIAGPSVITNPRVAAIQLKKYVGDGAEDLNELKN